MYTIFINEVPIFLTDNIENESKYFFQFKNKTTIGFLLDRINNGNFKEAYLYHASLDVLWKDFKDYFKIEVAAGGLIKNKEGETLFIYRLGKWDLPKGKIEKGESKKMAAIREVKEECDLDEVSIEKKIQTTYHIFERNSKETLKVTHWYLMKTDYKGMLTPQLEEGITDVVFKNEIETRKALENTYGNIKLLFLNNF